MKKGGLSNSGRNGVDYFYARDGPTGRPEDGGEAALIKKKTKLSSYIRKYRWDRVKVIYEEGLPNI